MIVYALKKVSWFIPNFGAEFSVIKVHTNADKAKENLNKYRSYSQAYQEWETSKDEYMIDKLNEKERSIEEHETIENKFLLQNPLAPEWKECRYCTFSLEETTLVD